MISALVCGVFAPVFVYTGRSFVVVSAGRFGDGSAKSPAPPVRAGIRRSTSRGPASRPASIFPDQAAGLHWLLGLMEQRRRLADSALAEVLEQRFDPTMEKLERRLGRYRTVVQSRSSSSAADWGGGHGTACPTTHP